MKNVATTLVGSMIVLAAGGCGRGLDWLPGAAIDRDNVVRDHQTPSLGEIGRPCGTLGSGGVRTTALSSDERLVALGYGSGRVALHRFADAAAPLTFQAHQAPISALLFTPDGDLLSGSSNGEVKRWSSADGSPLGTLIGGVSEIRQLLTSPDGSVLVALEPTSLRGWSRTDGRALWLHTFERGRWDRLIRAGNHFLLTGLSRNDLRDFLTGTPQSVGAAGLTGRTIFAVSPDGTLGFGLVEGGAIGTIRASYEAAVFRFPGGERLWGRRTGGIPQLARFSVNGSRVALLMRGPSAIASEVDGSELEAIGLAVYDVQSGQARYHQSFADIDDVLPTAQGEGFLLQERPEGGRLLKLQPLGSAGNQAWTIAAEPGHLGRLSALALSADGTALASASGGSIRIWDVASGGQKTSLAGRRTFVRAPDGEHLLALRKPLPASEVPPDEEPPRASGPDFDIIRISDGTVSRSFGEMGCYLASFTPGGEQIWTACLSATAWLRRFRVSDGREDAQLPSTGAWPVALQVSADGQRLAVRDARGHVGLTMWDLPSGRRLWAVELPGMNDTGSSSSRSGGTVEPSALAFSPDGELLVVSVNPRDPAEAGRSTRVYAADTGRLLADLDMESQGGLTFSEDGTLLAAVGSWVTLRRTSDWGSFRPFGRSPWQTSTGAGILLHDDQLLFGDADLRLQRWCEVKAPEPWSVR